MAIIRQRVPGGVWLARFFDRDGRRIERSTGETDEAEALAAAREMEAAARAATSAGRFRDRLAELNRIATGAGVTPTVAAWCKTWMDTRRLSVVPSTARFYQHAIDDFLRFLGPAANKAVDLVQPEQVEAWRNAIAKERAKKTANHRHKILRMVFRAARLRGHISRDPAEAVATLRRDSSGSPRRAFTHDELARLLAACPSPEWKSLVMFGIYTGQRLKDLCLLRWKDIEGGVLAIQTGKTGRAVRIPLAAPLVAFLTGYRPPGPFVHPAAAAAIQANQRASSGTVARQFMDILAKAGLRGKRPHRKAKDTGRQVEALSFHALRHTCVSLLATAGVPRAVAMEIAGHESEAVHRLYTHVGDEAMKAALEKMPVIAG
jgi:integrase